jgi:alpha-ketoglutaric semialdehyde dehydrogenase
MTFRAANPIDGSSVGAEITDHTEADVNSFIERAAAVSHQISDLSPQKHSKLLRTIAIHIEKSRETLIATACKETALPEGRIGGEVTRTTVQFERFAELVESGDHLKVVIDRADPNYSPAPRPDIRKMNRPLGVVAIFAASNFPLAFSVGGGDAASALAAIIEGCIKAAIRECGLSEDLYSIVQGVNPMITHWLALHPKIQAVGFTGSEAVGRILVDLAASRKFPIPVYAEMGSLNPVFITNSALAERNESLAKGLVDSALMGSGQFCTKPGLVFVPDSAEFFDVIREYLSSLAVAPLLSKSISERYSSAISELVKINGVEVMAGVNTSAGFGVTPTFFITDWETARSNTHLLEEHFGPTTVIVKTSEKSFVEIASMLHGQLTSTIQSSYVDSLAELIEILSQKSGRVIWNGFPTGVAVTAAMTHGGPWPSSSTHTTSVGIDAIYRFLRPVSFQGLPQQSLPEALQDANPWKVPQRIN